jgi:hypothetical protein
VLYAVTELNSVDVRSLCSGTVCGRMSLSLVVCVCVRACAPGVPVLVKSGHGVLSINPYPANVENRVSS